MYTIELPIRVVSEANMKEHWHKSAKRHTHQKNAVSLMLRDLPYCLPCHVKLTRIAPRKLDAHDNLRSGLKWIVDAIAASLTGNYVAGRADDSEMISWSYAQEKGLKNTYGIRIEIMPKELEDGTALESYIQEDREDSDRDFD
jgi:hypothetical protein